MRPSVISLYLGILLPPADQGISVKPFTGMCMSLIWKQIHRVTRDQKLHREHLSAVHYDNLAFSGWIHWQAKPVNGAVIDLPAEQRLIYEI